MIVTMKFAYKERKDTTAIRLRMGDQVKGGFSLAVAIR
jgi:hypothetical protein